MTLEEIRRERKAAIKGCPRAHVEELVWVCQTAQFMSQLSRAYCSSKDRKTNILAYALACIRVGKMEYDLIHRDYDRPHWAWTDERLRNWLTEEQAKYDEEQRALKRAQRARVAQ